MASAEADRPSDADAGPETASWASHRGLAQLAVSRFDEWLRRLEPARRRATTTVTSFAVVAILGLVGMIVAAFVPGPRDFFRLDFWPALIPFIPTIGLGFPMAVLEAAGRLSLRAFGCLSLIGAFCFQTFMWGLVVYTSLPGSSAMAAFPILLVSFHGHLYLSTFRAIFPLLTSICAFAVALALGWDRVHLPILCIAGPMALGSHLLLGYYAQLDYKARLEREALRAAVDAQILSDRSADVAEVSRVLNELRGRSHDAGNALSGLLLNMPAFLDVIESVRGRPTLSAETVALGRSIATGLLRLKGILAETSEWSRRNRPKPLNVAAVELIEDACKEVEALHPDVECILHAVPGLQHLCVPLVGGEEALRRVIMNLLLNACEGDGRHGAKHIDVAFECTDAELAIHIIDDGPGFSSGQLLIPLDRLTTTKPDGSGLGCYTAARVLSASGGTFARRNRAGRSGAEVTVRLRLTLDVE